MKETYLGLTVSWMVFLGGDLWTAANPFLWGFNSGWYDLIYEKFCERKWDWKLGRNPSQSHMMCCHIILSLARDLCDISVGLHKSVSRSLAAERRTEPLLSLLFATFLTWIRLISLGRSGGAKWHQLSLAAALLHNDGSQPSGMFGAPRLSPSLYSFSHTTGGHGAVLTHSWHVGAVGLWIHAGKLHEVNLGPPCRGWPEMLSNECDTAIINGICW